MVDNQYTEAAVEELTAVRNAVVNITLPETEDTQERDTMTYMSDLLESIRERSEFLILQLNGEEAEET
jgi:hypothetical protein